MNGFCQDPRLNKSARITFWGPFFFSVPPSQHTHAWRTKESGPGHRLDDHQLRARVGDRLHEAVHEHGHQHHVQSAVPPALASLLLHEAADARHLALRLVRLRPRLFDHVRHEVRPHLYNLIFLFDVCFGMDPELFHSGNPKPAASHHLNLSLTEIISLKPFNISAIFVKHFVSSYRFLKKLILLSCY